jgi:hypothetical protein
MKKDTGTSRTMSYDEALQDPSLADMHEAMRFVRGKPASVLYPRKHEKALTSVARMDTRKLFKKSPDMPLKEVVITVFKPLTDDIPAPLILILTQNIIEVWTELSLALQEENTVAIAA